ncbi:MAG: oligosaccharide flippase family protein [Acutalibacteraceae bacterium]
MRKTIFIKNAIILTISSLILRFAGIIFKVWVAKFIGSEGIGLYQLVFSFYMLAATFATSGISTAVTRLVSEELALGSKSGTIRILRRSIELTLIIALISVALVFFGAEFIAKTLIGDIRALPALKILPFSLPFMGVCSCLRGYFIAVRRVTPNAVGQIFEQAVRIGLIIFLVKQFAQKGLAIACAAVLAGDTGAEIISCLLLFVVYLFDKKKLNHLSGRKNPPYPITKKLLQISIPLTSGRYLNTALRTGENVLVPKNLARHPFSGELALSQFGMIKGMALPVLFFPSTLLNSISTLLIPEMSEAAAKKQMGGVRSATGRILKLTVLISYIFAAIFWVAGQKIGLLIYNSEDVGFLLTALSPIVPFMYLDSISDGILKGLDQQNYTFFTAISDSTLRIILILLLLPITGLNGFIGIMYFSNFYTCYLHVKRLQKLSGAKLQAFKDVIFPLGCAALIAFAINQLLKIIGIGGNLVYIIILVAISLPLYAALLLAFGVVEKEEILYVFKR